MCRTHFSIFIVSFIWKRAGGLGIYVANGVGVTILASSLALYYG